MVRRTKRRGFCATRLNWRFFGILSTCFVCLAIGFTVHRTVCADEKEVKKGQIYSTWEGLEADKCASIWVIRRFVDAEAQFKFLPKGTLVQEGIPFDTPTSELSRDARQAAFGKVLTKYKLDDPVLRDINKIIWDIEVNKWEKKVTNEAHGVNSVVQGLILSIEDENQCLDKTDIVFDGLYAYLKAYHQAGKKND